MVSNFVIRSWLLLWSSIPTYMRGKANVPSDFEARKTGNWRTSNHSLPGTLHFGAALENVGTSWQGFGKNVQVEDMWLATFQHSMVIYWSSGSHRICVSQKSKISNFWHQCFHVTKVHTGCQVRTTLPQHLSQIIRIMRTVWVVSLANQEQQCPKLSVGFDWHNIVLVIQTDNPSTVFVYKHESRPHEKHWHLRFSSIVSF